MISENNLLHFEKGIKTLSLKHSISEMFLFDKLTQFDKKLELLMADGRSYSFQNKKLVENKLLSINGESLSIVKESANSFYLKNDSKTIVYNSKNELGAIQVLGSLNGNAICSIEEVIQYKPQVIVNRKIASYKDAFDKPILEFTNPTYSILKSEFKIHENKLFIAELNENELIIKSKTIKS